MALKKVLKEGGELKQISLFELPIQKKEEDWRANVSSILRSSLFGVVGRRKRSFMHEGVELASYAGSSLVYSGPQLGQFDGQVWEEMIFLFNEYQVNKIQLSAYEFLKRMGMDTGENQYKALENSINALRGASVKFVFDRPVEIDGKQITEPSAELLRAKTVKIDGVLHVEITLDHTWNYIFSPSNTTHIDRPRINRLNSEIAKWLGRYFSTHSTKNRPHEIGIKQLHQLSGSQGPFKTFTHRFEGYMNELVAVGLVEWFEVCTYATAKARKEKGRHYVRVQRPDTPFPTLIR